MTVHDIHEHINGLPYMTTAAAEWMTGLIHRHGLVDLLEVGHLHGVSTCYLAAAAAANGGTVTTVDIIVKPALVPSVSDLLKRCGLDNVEVFLEPRNVGGEWRLMHFLKEGRTFDFCYLDSLHEWSCTASQFCAVAQLLRPGGWLVLDDIHYAYSHHPKGERLWVDALPKDQKEEHQVRNVWNLLIKPDARFQKFGEACKMGFCQKL